MREATSKNGITSFWKKELPEMNSPQIASAVLAFLMLATMMARSTEVITKAIEQKKEYLESKEIVAEYSNEVVMQDKMLQKFATV